MIGTPRETETEILRSRELLAAVLDHAPGFIMAIDALGKLVFINRVLPQHDVKDVIGSDFLQYLPPDQHDSLRTWFRAALETEIAEDLRVERRRSDGRKAMVDDAWVR